MCNCGNSNCCNGIPIGKQGPAGATGAAGSNGQYGGFSSRWLFSTTTSSNPSSTTLRLNNSSPASATLIYVNETNADSTNVQPFLNSFSNGGSFGLIRIFKEFNSAVFADFQVGLVVDSGSYFSIGVTYVSGSGSFAANDSVVLSFAANGAAGAAGTNGTNGVAVIDTLWYDVAAKSNTIGGAASTFGSPAVYSTINHTLWMDTNGDELIFEAIVISNNNAAKSLTSVGVVINSIAGLGGNVPICLFLIGNGADGSNTKRAYRIKGKITRISATTLRAESLLIPTEPAVVGAITAGHFYASADSEVSSVVDFTTVDISCPSFAANTYLLS